MSEWQPIETAPKDGTVILGIYVNGKYDPDYSIICWGGRTWVGMCDGYESIEAQGDTYTEYHTPFCTHWMPLPDPPQ